VSNTKGKLPGKRIGCAGFEESGTGKNSRAAGFTLALRQGTDLEERKYMEDRNLTIKRNCTLFLAAHASNNP
jgi:hypothetical protein